MPSHETFSIKPIAEFVFRYAWLSKVSVDPFARNCKFANYTNDLNPNTLASSHMDATDFLNKLADEGVVADLVIIDPPYSPTQVKKCYDSIGLKVERSDVLSSKRRKLKVAIGRLVKVGGIVLNFGWNTTGMGKGWTIMEIMLVCHGSDHNDTICMAEARDEA